MTTTGSTAAPPLEGITFGDLRIESDARVLRPRAWTSAQSRWAADLLASSPTGPVLELCAGAGQIGLLAAALAPDRSLVCVDVDPVACGYARANAARAGLGHRVEIRESRLEEAIGPDEQFALVIADPPWVRRVEIGRFPEDPELAIDGGDDGLEVARACLTAAAASLLPSGSVLLQLGQLEQVEALRHDAIEHQLDVVDVRGESGGVLVRLQRRSGSPEPGDDQAKSEPASS